MNRNKTPKRKVDGWLVIDKPAGPSSSALVNKAKWAFCAKKAGHAGTLDPQATGVLAIAFGEATKTVPFVTDSLKAYHFRMRLGQSTNTDDSEGEILQQSECRPETSQIVGALAEFTGDIFQTPPQFSAVKIEGERAYKRARAGEAMALQPRPLFVKSLTLLNRPDREHVDLELICGKGGYVRAIARDLGLTLGCLGHVAWLRRIWSGPFNLEHAINLETLQTLAQQPELDGWLLPLEVGLESLPQLSCDALAAESLRHGNAGVVGPCDLQESTQAWVACAGVPVAIGTYAGGALLPSRVFAEDLK